MPFSGGNSYDRRLWCKRIVVESLDWRETWFCVKSEIFPASPSRTFANTWALKEVRKVLGLESQWRCRNSMLWWPLRRSLLLPRLQPWFILICLRGISHASVSNFRLLFFDTIPSFSFWSKAVCQLQLSNSERASFQWIPPDRLHNLNNQLWSETDICNHDDIFFTLDKVCFASRKKSALAEGDITIYAQTNFRL